MSTRVFISYSETDYEKVRMIAEEIEQSGLKPWFAPNSLSAGASLSLIADQIESAQYFVVALSRSSINSKWVRKEIDLAVNLELSEERKPLQVVPVLIDKVLPPAILADKIFVDLTGPNWNAGLHELVSILTGKRAKRETGLSRFQAYLKNLVQMPDDTCDDIRTIEVLRPMRPGRGEGQGVWHYFSWSQARKSRRRIIIEQALRELCAFSRYSALVLEEFDAGRYLFPIFPGDDDDETGSMVRIDWDTFVRVRSSVEESLGDAGMGAEDTARVLAAYDECEVLPIIGVAEKEKVTAWVRQADEQLVALTGALWKARTREGLLNVDTEWLTSFASHQAQDISDDEAEWRAEQLITRAKQAGLLTSTTASTGFEIGPMVFEAGRLVADFELSEITN